MPANRLHFALRDADTSPQRVMGSLPVSRLLPLGAVCAVAVAWAGSGAAQPAAPAAVLTQATGDLHVTNSQEGRAIFQATGLAPGRSVSGTVRLANTGSLPGDLGLQQLGLRDQPGAGGGRLSDVVHLNISDITAGSSVPIFTGQLGGSAAARSAPSAPATRARSDSRPRCPRAATTPTPAPASRSAISGRRQPPGRVEAGTAAPIRS
jgi:hypothetical protein